MKKRKIIKGLLISSSIAILTLSIPLSLCLTKKQENNLSVSNNISNSDISNTNKINNTTNPLNSNINYYVNNGFYTAISNNENVITIGQITYSLNNTNFTASVINIANGISELTIPGMIIENNNFYDVTSIAQGACFNKQLSSVSFPDSIVSIGADAFANNLLTNITLPNSLVNLGNNAFSNNPFYEGTVINLPSSCVWNKNANLAPFNNNQNAGQFTRCVKYVIQNLAVYGYVYQSNCWKIVSWMPQVASAFSNEVKSDNHIFTVNQNISNPVNQPATTSNFTFQQLSLNYDPIQKNAIIVWGNSSNNVQQIYGFGVSNNNPTFYWENPSYIGSTSNFVLNISNPNTNKEIYSNLNSYPKTQTSIPINYGDVVGIYATSNNAALVTGMQASKIQNLSDLANCGISQYFSYDYNSMNDQIDYFIITQNGFIPYQNLMHVNVNCLQENVKDFVLTGTALANHLVSATINGTTYKALSNSNGQFSIAISPSSPIALGTTVYVQCQGCLTYVNSLVGKNPLNAGFLFEDGNNFGILPDGYTGNFQLWNTSVYSMP
ncbi:MAG: leucine-rich repeat protein, partial [Mycoplasmataceae bacterium]|nr:leucine-rich repeat protein [Mycoplasmataceae bacterium]